VRPAPLTGGARPGPAAAHPAAADAPTAAGRWTPSSFAGSAGGGARCGRPGAVRA
jgi:hypothetical protein